MSGSLAGRPVVLVGGTGGLGVFTAELLAREGANLTLTYHQQAERARAMAHLGRVMQVDITQAEQRRALLAAVPDLHGLVVFTGAPVRATDAGTWEEQELRSHAVNFLGPILMAREAATLMRERGTPGAIVLLATMQAMMPFADSTPYAAPKAALVHAARVLAKEMRGPANVRVNVVSPGVIDAGMAAVSIARGKYDRYLADGAIPRWGHGNDVARAVRFLLEPDGYVTGQVITVDGGLTL